MSTTSPTIPRETARHVLWRYDRQGGCQPAPFTEHLMAAIERADYQNRAILRGAYPALSEAMHLARYYEGGLAKLQAIATGQAPSEEIPAPQCPEALFNPDTGDLRRCVQDGRHEDHQTADGTQWRIDLDATAGVPW